MLVLTQAQKKNLTEHNSLSHSRQARHRCGHAKHRSRKEDFYNCPERSKTIFNEFARRAIHNGGRITEQLAPRSLPCSAHCSFSRCRCAHVRPRRPALTARPASSTQAARSAATPRAGCAADTAAPVAPAGHSSAAKPLFCVRVGSANHGRTWPASCGATAISEQNM